MKTIKEKMLEANKARTDILSDNPEINSKWTPDAIGIMEANRVDGRDLSEEAEDEILKSTGKIDFTKDSEYIRLFGERDLKKEKVCLYESKSNE